MSSINEIWESYRAKVVPDNACHTQIEDTRCSFFAGTGTMFALMVKGSDEPEDAAVSNFEKLSKELDEFHEEVAAKALESRG